MIIILNGPPGSGKDTIANYFVDHHEDYITDSFKSALYFETVAYFGLNLEQFTERHSNRKLKEIPYHFYKGVLLSTREMLIHVSEKIIKPFFGQDHFGRMKGSEWLSSSKDIIISDGGFVDETNAVCDKVGFENVLIVRLVREGYDFSGDSRDYIKSNESKCKVVDIHLLEGDVGRACFEIYGAVLSL